MTVFDIMTIITLGLLCVAVIASIGMIVWVILRLARMKKVTSCRECDILLNGRCFKTGLYIEDVNKKNCDEE